MAQGRKRIWGGVLMLVVGVALAGVIAVSRNHPVEFPFGRLNVRLMSGSLGFSRFEKSVSYDRAFRMPEDGWGPKRLVWWIDLPSYDVNAGIVAAHTYSWGLRGNELVIHVLLWPPAVLALAAGAAAWRLGFVARRRWKNAHKACPICGYARVGLAESAPCPECGRAAGAINTLAAARGS